MRRIKNIAQFAVILCAALIISTQKSHAECETLSWEAPTKNVDGSPLTDLNHYRLYAGCTQSGTYDLGHNVVPHTALSASVCGLPAHTMCYFVATSVNDAEQESAYSGEAILTTGGPPLELPHAVENLFVTWQETTPSTSLYELPITDFTGTPIIAGNWSVVGQQLDISFDVLPRSFPTHDARIISKASGTAEHAHHFMVSMWQGHLRFRLKTGGITKTLQGSQQIPTGVMTSGRVTYDGSEMVIFVDGVRDAAISKSGDMDSSLDEVWVGANPPDGHAPWDGTIRLTVH